MTTAVQLRRGTTAEHATFTGLEGETTVDTTKTTLVVHNGSTAGGFAIAREDLANVSPANLPVLTGADTASDDKFLIYDQSALTLKQITRAELNTAITQGTLSNVQIISGTINGTTIGGTTAAAGSFTTLNSSGATTLNGTTIPSSVTLVSTAATQTLTNKTLTSPTISGGTLNNISIGATTASTGAFTNLAYTGTLTGGTGVINIGSGQLYKDASGNVGIGTSSPATRLDVNADASIHGVRVGRGAGAVSTNTAVGASALAANTSGSVGVAVGSGALAANTSGAGGTALGYNALTLNTTGNWNMGIGVSALAANTTGSNNIGIGQSALTSNTTADNNTAVGYQAAFTNSTGTQVTAFGVQAGYTNNANNGAFFGYQAGYSNTTGTNNAAFGAFRPLYANTTGSFNTAIGDQALLSNTTASNNTAVGYQAGFSNTTGAQNLNLGYQSGFNNTTGNWNTLVGVQAGLGLTTGSSNTFVGASGFGGAGRLVTTGTANTILGGFSGNQGGLDIRTANNHIVLSDGDGVPNMVSPGSETEWLMRSGQGFWTVFSNGGGNNSTYNGALIGANKLSLAAQSNTALPSWFIDIGGRAADGTNRPPSTADKFSVGRQAAGGTLLNAANLFEVNANGCVGLNTTAASTGTGITFPATQNASSNANTLDDYEEGTWTASISSQNNMTNATWNSGRYTKIGNLVTVQGEFNCTITSSNTLTFVFLTLPFNVAGADQTGVAFVNNSIKVGVGDLSSNTFIVFVPAASAIVSGSELIQVAATYMTT